MKQRLTRDDLAAHNPTDAQVNRILRYRLFQSACRILEAGCTNRKLFRRQRAALEKKLGYDLLTKKP